MKKKGMIVCIICISILITPSITTGYNCKILNEKVLQSTTEKDVTQIDDHIWPMHRYDAQRTGHCPYDTSQNMGGEKWKYFIDQSLHKTPTIDQNGTLYVGTGLRQIHAVYPDGTRKWKQEFDGLNCMVITISNDTLYHGFFKGFHAIYPNGTVKWKINKSDYFLNSVFDSNGTIYVGTADERIYAIYPNGTIKWKFKGKGSFVNIALDKNNNIYFDAPTTLRLYCLDSEGNLKWIYKKLTMEGPVIADDGTIFVKSEGYLVALYPNGTEKWVIEFPRPGWYGRPTLSHDGKIIMTGDHCEYVTALDPADGSIIWQYKIADDHAVDYVSLAAIGGDDSIYFAYNAYSDSVAFLVALNSDGSLKWETHLTTDVHPYSAVHVFSDPSIGSDGTVYITSWFTRGGSNYTDIGYIHAIGIDNPVAPDAPSISGPSNGKIGIEYEYILNCNISTGGDVFYLIDWGDKAYSHDSKWFGPYPSGEEVKINHTYKKVGEYTIKVRAKGNDSLCSPWSYLEVSMPRNKIRSDVLLLRFLEQFPLLNRFLTLLIQ